MIIDLYVDLLDNDLSVKEEFLMKEQLKNQTTTISIKINLNLQLIQSFLARYSERNIMSNCKYNRHI